MRLRTCLVALALGSALAAGTLCPSPALAASGSWRSSGGRWWYAYSQGGYAKSGWEKIGGRWYLFDGAGWMRTGWAKSGSTWYYLDSSGAMAEGWRQVGGTWYYLTPGSGAMAVGWRSIGGTWYHLRPSGAMSANRWQGNYWLGSSGAMATSAWVDSGRYYVGADGCWIPNAQPAHWVRDTKGWRWVREDGSYPHGQWATINGHRYLFNAAGYRLTGWQTWGAATYYLGSDGILVTNRWVGDRYVGATGVMATNQAVGNCYVDAQGHKVTNAWVGDKYYDATGTWVPGKQPESATSQESTTASSDPEPDVTLDTTPGFSATDLPSLGQLGDFKAQILRDGDYGEGLYLYGYSGTSSAVTIPGKVTVRYSTGETETLPVVSATLASCGLTELTLSGCDHLAYLDCSNNQLDVLDLTQAPELQALYCQDNVDIEALDFSGCPQIQTLFCGASSLRNTGRVTTALATLNLSGCDQLRELECSLTALTRLDLSACTQLELLACQGASSSTGAEGRLAYLLLPQTSTLKEVYVSCNQLTQLEAPQCTGLVVLECAYNQLELVDFSDAKAWETVSAAHNRLSSRVRFLAGCWSHEFQQLDLTGNLISAESLAPVGFPSNRLVSGD